MTNGETAPEQFRAGWRFHVGVFFFGLGIVCPIFIPLIRATGLSTEVKATLSGALVVGIPQLFSLTAIAFMGRSGFNYIRGKLFGLLRRAGPPPTVSRTRYRIGLVLFTVPLLFGWLGPYLADHIPGYAESRVTCSVVGDLVLLSSFFVLGGEFWEKVRALFMYDAKARIPGPLPA
jgi:hypothetical protein